MLHDDAIIIQSYCIFLYCAGIALVSVVYVKDMQMTCKFTHFQLLARVSSVFILTSLWTGINVVLH